MGRLGVAAVLLAALALVLAAMFAPRVAHAAETYGTDANGYTTVIPKDDAYGTTINLFDYWTTSDDESGRFDADGAFTADDINRGINRFGGTKDTWPIFSADNGGLHQLLFANNLYWLKYPTDRYPDGYYPWGWLEDLHSRSKDVNLNSGDSPQSGMVKNTLNAAGYPELQANESIGLAQDEDLNYLFDESDVDSGQAGKKAFSDVKGLLDVDDDGYYNYDSTKNFASFDEASNRFTIYAGAAVKPNNAASSPGQFFPFNTAEQVYSAKGDGTAQNTPSQSFSAANAKANHYFGLTMDTRFQQPENGEVKNSSGSMVPMTYEFTGDDDVWVYVDGVLVGDLGGVHKAMSLKIDFQTGAISVNGASDGTLRSKFSAAGKDADTKWAANTFATGTYHTLKFFYMERGNSDSNMSLKFNLMTVPTSDVIKVDQNGAVLPGVGFELYAANADHTPKSDQPLASGTTNQYGELELLDSAGRPISFDEQYNGGQGDFNQYYNLVETNVPAGYSKLVNEIHLKYELDKNDATGTRGVLYQDPDYSDPASNVWNTGSLAMPKEIVSAKNDVRDGDDASKSYTYDELEQGTLFAMVFRKDVSTGEWHAVTGGNQVDGWDVSEAIKGQRQNVVDAFKGSADAQQRVFKLKPSGALELSLEDLPGTITDYSYWQAGQGNPNGGTYDVAFYYSESASVEGITAANTHLLSDDSFSHAFSVKLYVSNTRNELFVQKVDEEGRPVPGAQFGLFSADQVNVGTDGSVTVPDGTAPKATATTADLSKAKGDLLNLAGGGVFGAPRPGESTSDSASAYDDVDIESGVYYVKELAAPSQYVLNETVTKVIVDDNGVYADAGTATDGVRVVRGVGNLVRPLTEFASGTTNDTLRWITSRATRVTVDSNNKIGFGAWDNQGSLYMGTVTDGSDANGANVPGVLRLERDSNGALVQADANSRTHLDRKEATGSAIAYGPLGGDGSGNQTVFATDEGWMTIATTQDKRPDGASTAPSRTELGETRLSSIVTGSALIQVTNKYVTPGDLVVKKVVELPGGLDVGSSSFADAKFEFTLTFADASGAALPADRTFQYQVFDVAADGTETPATGDGTTGTVASGGVVALGHDQTVHVSGLPVGTAYTVTETAAEGFSTTAKDSAGGTGTTDASGNVAIAGSIPGSDDVTVTFTNTHERGLKIHKEDEHGSALTGAKFTVSSAEPANLGYTQEREVLAHGDQAYATFDGLVNGATYTIEETYVPTGYTKMRPNRTLTISADGGTVTITGDDGATTARVSPDADGDLSITIQNTRVPDLPQAGGFGNAPLFAAGFAVMAGATLLLSSARVDSRRGR